MVSAKTMVELADQNVNNHHITEIDDIVTNRAKAGKFFAKLWAGKPESMDTQLVFTERYDIESYNHVIRLGYVITTIKDAFDVVSLYIGWGFDSSSSLRVAIKSEEAEEQKHASVGEHKQSEKGKIGLGKKLFGTN